MSQTTATRPLSPYWHLYAFVVIALLIAVIYANTLKVPFHFDGQVNIERNPYVHIQSLDPGILRDAALESPLPARPLANISFALNHYFSGLNTGPYHMVNIIIHMLNSMLVYLLAYMTFRLLKAKTGEDQRLDYILAALVTACIFAAHPLQTQSVTYIVQRMNSMATLFYLLALVLYITARRGSFSKVARSIMAGGSILAWLCALGSKETAVMLPFAIFLYEWYFFQDCDPAWLRRRAVLLVPGILFLIVIVLLYLGGSPLDRILAQYQGRDFTLGERLLTQPRVIIFYISLLFAPLPSRMNFNHDFMLSHTLLDPFTTVISIMVLTVLLGWAVVYRRKYRLLSFCVIWFSLHLVIESSVLALEIIYEHRVYLPLLSLALAGGYAFLKFRPVFHRAVPTATCVMLVLLAVNAHIRNEAWASSESLWRDVVSKAPGNARAHYNLGSALLELENTEEAMYHLRRAITIKPDYGEAYVNLGNALKRGGDISAAIEQYETAARFLPGNAVLHYNKGHALSLLHRYPQAIQSYLRAIDIAPGLLPAQFNVAELFEVTREYDKAIEHYQAVVRLDPSFAPAYEHIGGILQARGNNQAAAEEYARALVVNPDQYSARVKLASLFLQNGRVESACKLMQNLPGLSGQASLQAAVDRFNEICGE